MEQAPVKVCLWGLVFHVLNVMLGRDFVRYVTDLRSFLIKESHALNAKMV